MELAGIAINAFVVAAIGVILGWLGKGRLDAQDARMDRLEARLEDRIDGLEYRMGGLQASLEGRMGGLDASIDGLRSDLTQVALAVGARPRAADPRSGT